MESYEDFKNRDDEKLDTSENEEIKLGTKEIREFNFPKRAILSIRYLLIICG